MTGLRPKLLAGGLALVLLVPLAVALGVLHSPRWFPIGDLAQTELHVRDAWSRDPPLVGLPGRIGDFGQQGSHPGPLSFWLLAPLYRLLGARPWALQAATAAFHAAAVVLALWLAARRGRWPLVAGTGAALALLLRTYGGGTLTEAWNPYLPVSWWVVVLLGVWSLLCDDLAVLPLVVFAAAVCVQTHVGYVPLVGTLALLSAAAVVATARARRRRVVPWVAGSLAVAAVLWLPPLVEQLTEDPGNLTVIWRHFTSPPETQISVSGAMELFFVHLDPWRLIARRASDTTGSVIPGALFLAVWAVSAVIARRRRSRHLVRLHLLLAVTLVAQAVAMTRIFGTVWFYLVLWAWATTALMLVAVGWTAADVVRARRPVLAERRATTAAVAGLAAFAVGWSAFFAVDAAYTEPPAADLSRVVGRLAGPVTSSLDRSERYVMTWTDPVAIGTQGYGLFLELQRRRFDVGAVPFHRAGVRDHRVRRASEATAMIHLSTGADIARWRATPGAREIAYVDPRTARQRAEFERLRRTVTTALQRAGRAELARGIDTDLFALVFDPRLPADLSDDVSRMLRLGQPAAVFTGPPTLVA